MILQTMKNPDHNSWFSFPFPYKNIYSPAGSVPPLAHQTSYISIQSKSCVRILQPFFVFSEYAQQGLLTFYVLRTSIEFSECLPVGSLAAGLKLGAAELGLCKSSRSEGERRRWPRDERRHRAWGSLIGSRQWGRRGRWRGSCCCPGAWSHYHSLTSTCGCWHHRHCLDPDWTCWHTGVGRRRRLVGG
jgi:hypothetical protein